MNDQPTASKVKVADETWIATALLHIEQPDRSDFTIDEIVSRAEKEGLHHMLRPGVRVHATLHCVANKSPNPGRYRMLYATGRSTRRLYKPGDPHDPARREGKITPESEEIPPKYRRLLDWYFNQYAPGGKGEGARHSILTLWGVGRDLWADEDPDLYVKRLREGWQ